MDFTIPNEPFVSVIVPFWGPDVGQLRECATAILAQRFPRNRFELIVVDNHPTPNPDLAALLPPGCTLLHEPRPGSYSARNRGLAEATGETIVFIDADCRPCSDWLRIGVEALLHDPGVGFIGGRIEMTTRADMPNVVELYDLCLGLNQENYVTRDGFCATANLFTRKCVIERVGRFDDAVYSGGDRIWGERAAALGVRCVYNSAAVVQHPARATLPALLTRSRRIAAADYKRARAAGSAGIQVHVQQSTDELVFAAIRLMRIVKRGPEFGIVAVCGALGVAAIVALIKGVECVRLALGGRPQR